VESTDGGSTWQNLAWSSGFYSVVGDPFGLEAASNGTVYNVVFVSQ
jgi:hypothetical protein